MTEPEQPDFRKLWRELQDECQREGNGAAVQLLQRAFEERERKLREALRPFAFIGEDNPEDTQAVWEMIYRDRVQDRFSYEDFEAARAALGEKP